jgi:hypothetical protein
MNEITKATSFDAEILKTTWQIGNLIRTKAPFSEIEQEQYKLASLLEQKRKSLYETKDPSYFVDQILRCTLMTDRREKAAQLAEQVLAAMNAILEAEVSDCSADPESLAINRETLAVTLKFLRAFSHPDRPVYEGEAEPAGILSISQFSDIPDHVKKVLDHIIEPLVIHGFLSPENGRYLATLLQSPSLASDVPPPVDWLGDTSSIVTTFILAHAIGEADLKDKTHRNQEFLDKPEVHPTYLTLIEDHFNIMKGASSHTTIHRRVETINQEFPLFCELVQEVRRNQRPSFAPVAPLPDVKSIITCFIHRWANQPSITDDIKNQCPTLDEDILRVFYEAYSLDDEAEDI